MNLTTKDTKDTKKTGRNVLYENTSSQKEFYKTAS